MNAAPSPKTDEVRLNDMVCFALHAASRAITATYRPLLEPLGLTYPQYLVLAALWEQDDRTVGELVELLQLDYGTMTPLLKRLEKRGFLRRTRSPDDERSVIVGLTREGERLRASANGIYQAISEKFDLSANRARSTHKMLQSIIEKANH
ncbi:MarR family winged helix-turn-helix transcriptional regulator [Mycobacterium montefiorense]|uniref:MarR family transcriptional regulator n=1 Tax=Mycobacterium montefiorense TaxID=154654 RepID=A0AA37PLH5_9MYCO|nr:MarR family transcriptional regulator [Mycobacterium montefiorense]GBG36993.1 MarR family transcriptional regulator [Mycobacterium montefiorense]GKU32870.1 MarR family transcriptional regulator [Mycobacterium montefiorense]GKU42547.1 MarR family transcriptional regulator [Mycobacterium montefiorense]GKU48296.1 MarR family transcriptional regulator [Mycobacterium montefiorense]GKU50798.1 MarR family transcriptional regulator [Mycobacterium montefiorense]